MFAPSPKKVTANQARNRNNFSSEEPKSYNALTPISKKKKEITKKKEKNLKPHNSMASATDTIKNTNMKFSAVEKGIDKVGKDNKKSLAAESRNTKGLLGNLTKYVGKKIDSLKIVMKDLLETSGASLAIDREALEEQKEAEYRAEHDRKFSLKKAAGKVKEVYGKGVALAKKIPEKAGGILKWLVNAALWGYVLKKFWPMIEKWLIPVLKKYVPSLKQIGQFMKDHWDKILAGGLLLSFLKSPVKFMMAPFKLALATGGFIFKGISELTSGVFSKLLGKGGILGKAISGLATVATTATTKLASVVTTAGKAVGNKLNPLTTVGPDGKPAKSSLAKKVTSVKGKGPGLKNALKIGKAGIGKGLGHALKAAKVLVRFIPYLGLALIAYDVIDTLFPELFKNIGKFISDFSGNIWEFVTAGFEKLSGWISEKWNNLSDIIAPVWQTVTDGFMKTIKWLMLDKVGEWIAEKFSDVTEFVMPLWNRVTAGISALGTWIGEKFMIGADFYINLWTKVFEGIGKLGTWIADKFTNIKELVTPLWNKVVDGLSAIGTWIADKFVDGATFYVDIWKKIFSGIGKIGTYIANKFSDSENIAEFGKDIWKDIKAGFQTVVDWVVGKIKGIGDWVENKVRNTKGIPDWVGNVMFGKTKATLQKEEDEKAGELATEKIEKSKAFTKETNMLGMDTGDWIVGKKGWAEINKMDASSLRGIYEDSDFSDDDKGRIKEIIKKKEKAKKQPMSAMIAANNSSYKSEKEKELSMNKKGVDALGNNIDNLNAVKQRGGIPEEVYNNNMSMLGTQLNKLLKKQDELKKSVEEEKKSKLSTAEHSGKEVTKAITGKPTDAKKDLVTKENSFNTGGWTGKGGDDEIAGLVHRNEYVLNQDALEQLNFKAYENDNTKEGREDVATNTKIANQYNKVTSTDNSSLSTTSKVMNSVSNFAVSAYDKASTMGSNLANNIKKSESFKDMFGGANKNNKGSSSPFYDVMSQIESKGDYNAHSKGSSYYGKYQFSKSTATPFLNKIGKTWDDYLADGSVQEQVVRMETDQNTTSLSNMDIPVNQLTLWTAHNLGRGSAKKIFATKDWNNPSLLRLVRNQAGKPDSVQAYLNQYSAKFGDGGVETTNNAGALESSSTSPSSFSFAGAANVAKKIASASISLVGDKLTQTKSKPEDMADEVKNRDSLPGDEAVGKNTETIKDPTSEDDSSSNKSAGSFKKPKRECHTTWIHCTANDNPKCDNVAFIKRVHCDPKPQGNGWDRMGYHYMIHKNGKISQVQSTEIMPYQAKEYNKGAIAIVLQGLNKKEFTPAQFASLKKLSNDINTSYEGKMRFRGHCEVSSKSCPVFDYKKVLKLDGKGKLGITGAQFKDAEVDMSTDLGPADGTSSGTSNGGTAETSGGVSDMLAGSDGTFMGDARATMDNIGKETFGKVRDILGSLGAINEDGTINTEAIGMQGIYESQLNKGPMDRLAGAGKGLLGGLNKMGGDVLGGIGANFGMKGTQSDLGVSGTLVSMTGSSANDTRSTRKNTTKGTTQKDETSSDTLAGSDGTFMGDARATIDNIGKETFGKVKDILGSIGAIGADGTINTEAIGMQGIHEAQLNKTPMDRLFGAGKGLLSGLNKMGGNALGGIGANFGLDGGMSDTGILGNNSMMNDMFSALSASKNAANSPELRNKGNTANSIKNIEIRTARPQNVELNNETKKLASVTSKPVEPKGEEKSSPATNVNVMAGGNASYKIDLDNSDYEDFFLSQLGYYY